MEEIQIQKTNSKIIPKEKNLIEKVNEANEIVEKIKSGEIKVKGLKIPRKAKVGRNKIKKGWIGIIKIEENGNTSGEKQKVIDSTIRLKDGTYHATDGREKVLWNGKFPVIFQPTWRLNPINLRRKENELNETYGQKYVMARMMKDAIKVKGKGMSGLIWLVILGVGGYILYSMFTGGA